MEIVNLLLDLLRFDAATQEYSFVDGAADAIDVLLDAILALQDPTPHVDDLIRLSCALESELRSPAAAVVLRSILCSDRRFLAALGVELHGGLDAVVKHAPMIDTPAPDGTIKAGALAAANSAAMPSSRSPRRRGADPRSIRRPQRSSAKGSRTTTRG